NGPDEAAHDGVAGVDGRLVLIAPRVDQIIDIAHAAKVAHDAQHRPAAGEEHEPLGLVGSAVDRIHHRVGGGGIEHERRVVGHEVDAQRCPLRADIERLEQQEHQRPDGEDGDGNGDASEARAVLPDDRAPLALPPCIA
ncbi:MAG: hypothetical protein ACK559_33355, partial [bacterium]